MKNRWNYPDYLTHEEAMKLSLEEFSEYCAFIVYMSNLKYRKRLAEAKAELEAGNDDPNNKPIEQSNSIKEEDNSVSDSVSVTIPQWSYQELHDSFMQMPVNELKEEYQAAMACIDCFFGVSASLVDSGLREYIDSWIDVMRIVISERFTLNELYMNCRGGSAPGHVGDGGGTASSSS